MRASRLLSILILLQTRGRLSAQVLARRFEVSVRTIYRDVDELSAAGVPIYAERGRTGGFALLDGYRTRLTGMTAAESDALALAGAGGAAQALGVETELATARLKLLASLSPEAGGSADRVARRFHLDTDGWYRRTPTPERLPQIAEALWSDRRIRIRYDSWKGDVTRELDPLGLVLKAGLWYLVAASSGSVRTYRVSAISELTVTESEARHPPHFDLAAWWTERSAAFERDLLRERVTIRISVEGRRRLAIINPAAAEVCEGGTPAAEPGWLHVDLPVESTADAVRQLLSLGAEVEVVGPADARRAMIAASRAIVGVYGDTGDAPC